jgi:hypothetical protein
MMSLFTNPWILTALAAASLPWIIEWLFRRRKRQVELPTLRFILDDKEQEQVKRQDQLLLILRTVAIILIVLGVARPALQQGLLGANAQRHAIILLDATASMHQRVGVTTSFGIAQKKAAAMVRALPAESTVSVALLGDTMEVLIDAETDVHTASGRIESARSGSGSGAMTDAIAWLKEYIAQKKWDNAEVYVFSDFQKHTWQPRGGGAEKMSRELRELCDAGDVFMIDVGGSPTFNLMVTALRPEERLLVTGRTTAFSAKIESTGTVPADRVIRVMFIVNGDKKAVQELPPGSTSGQVKFEHRFATAGDYLLEVQLEGDEHPIDNRRLYLCQVAEEVKVLVLDEGGSDASADTWFLSKAIDPVRRPGTERVSRFSVKTISPSQLTLENLEPYRAIAIGALSNIDEPLAARLEGYVTRGGAIWFFLGPKATPYMYNKFLYKEGRGVLPAKLADALTAPQPAPHLVFAGATSVAMADLQDSAGKDHAKIFSYIPMTVGATDGETLATLSNGQPALARKDFGRGQVVLCCSSAGPEWSLLPALPEFAVLTQGLLKQLAGDPDVAVNLNAGDAFQSEVFVSAQHLLLKRPDGSKERLTPQKKDGAEQMSIRYQKTDLDGVYNFNDVAAEVLARRQFVVNPRTEEGDLSRLQEDDLVGLLGSSGWSWLGPEQSVEDFVAKLHSVTELAPYLMLIVTAILAVESFLAVAFGKRRAEGAA